MANWTGFLTMLEREIVRFFTMPNNTIIPSIISTFLYLLIFGVGLGGRISQPGSNYLEFLVPGLVMLNLINNAYTNPSFSLFMARFLEHVHDFLTAPLSYLSMVCAYVAGGLIRGITMGAAAWAIALPFVIVPVKHFFVLVSFILLAGIVFSCFGIIAGLWADEFEHLNLILNFLITPLIFLGGVFYSVEQVPEAIALATKLNPLFYMISGVRYGMTGVAEAPLWIGYAILVPFAAILFFLSVFLFRKGWHLRT